MRHADTFVLQNHIKLFKFFTNTSTFRQPNDQVVNGQIQAEFSNRLHRAMADNKAFDQFALPDLIGHILFSVMDAKRYVISGFERTGVWKESGYTAPTRVSERCEVEMELPISPTPEQTIVAEQRESSGQCWATSAQMESIASELDNKYDVHFVDRVDPQFFITYTQ